MNNRNKAINGPGRLPEIKDNIFASFVTFFKVFILVYFKFVKNDKEEIFNKL